MALRVVWQVGGFQKFVKITAVVVHVPGDPDFTFGRQRHDLLSAQRIAKIFLGGGTERFNHRV